MARPRKSLTPEQRALLESMAKAGATATAIAKALGALGPDVSRQTVSRRLRALRGPQRARKAPTAPSTTDAGPPPPPARPVPSPEPSALGDPAGFDFHAWAEEVRRAADEAQSEGNGPLHARLVAIEFAARKEARKVASATPEGTFVSSLEMDAAAERARTKLLHLVESRAQRAEAERPEPEPCPACGYQATPPPTPEAP